ncbi:hypothetical protein [Rummeliibacillus sp. SL167]|uniref:hypothetical protein n=1 Tax=Rummeliibacillus sp. SL167 TaxID=2579792 RepID=UPI0011B67A26|nr:hypothetical protein [Rummeliibacillus sp. SL167]
MVVLSINEQVNKAICEVWLENLKDDYHNFSLLKEDTMKNSFYFHLRNKLGEDFLNANNLRIFTEYYIDGERIDLTVVKIDPIKATTSYLGDCVIEVIAAIEMKYKGYQVKDEIFLADVKKVVSYIEEWESNTHFYVAFIREKYVNLSDAETWLDSYLGKELKGNLTEMYAFWNEETDKMDWMLKNIK